MLLFHAQPCGGILAACYLLVASCGPLDNRDRTPSTKVEVVPGADGGYKLVHLVNGRPEGRITLFRPDGSIGAIFYLHNDSLQGVQRHFYPDGKLKLWEEAEHDRLHGRSYKWYPNGNLATIRQMQAGLRTGRFLEYYAAPTNQLRTRAEYVVVDGKEWENGYILYDSLGRITDCWGFPQVYADHDTIALGDSLTLHLRVRSPKEPLVLAAIGPFDEQFRLHDSDKLRVIYGQNHQVTISVPVSQRGPQVARGYLADYKPDPKEQQKGVTGTLERQMYFAYPYYVR